MIQYIPEELYYEINNYLNNNDSKQFEHILKNINKFIRFDYIPDITNIECDDFVAIKIDNYCNKYYQTNNFLSLISNDCLLKLILLPNIPINKIITTTKIRNEIQKIIIKNTNNIKLVEFNFIKYPLLYGENITYYNNINNSINTIYKYNKSGKLHGISINYSENYNINSLENYYNGLLHNEQYTYFEDTKIISSKYVYNNGKKINTWYEYYNIVDENNKQIIKSIINYKNNEKHGIQYYYHPNKNIYRTEKYNLGELIYSLIIPFDDNKINKIDIDIE